MLILNRIENTTKADFSQLLDLLDNEMGNF